MKKTIIVSGIVVIVLVLVLFVLRFSSGGEDLWICKGGQWVKHGNPSAPMPSTPCDSSVSSQNNLEKQENVLASQEQNIAQNATIKVETPLPSSVVKSPLRISGEAKGWYFEAVFPAKLVDENGKVLATRNVQAQDDWMTDSFVPFMATLTFNPGNAKKGTLILQKNNPSGQKEKDESISIPVSFE